MVLAVAAGLFVHGGNARANAPQAAGAAVRIVQPEYVRELGGEIYTFYAEREYRPLWLDERGMPTAAAQILTGLIADSALDGLDPAMVLILNSGLGAADAPATAEAFSRKELALSTAFVAYAQAMTTPGNSATSYEHESLRPQPRRAYHLLKAAAGAASLERFIADMTWMHPLYAPLRRGLVNAGGDGVRQIAIANLARIREIPKLDRQIVVNVASAELSMYENGQLFDTMRVVVGKPTTRTPLLAGYIRQAIVNPYWNVPAELVRSTIASNVLHRGKGYLAAGGYQVLSDWSADPAVVDPATIDWKAVSRGAVDLRVRQLPRPGNAMGRVKFEFPNAHDIYLHDTPDKSLMRSESRGFSAGCIRLEDAERLGRWLMQGQSLPLADVPEARIDLPRPVPIFVTYLTASTAGGSIVLGPDPYAMDSDKSKTLALGDPKRAAATP